MTAKSIGAEEFDRRFDEGEDMMEYLDLSKLRRPGREVQRVNVDFPPAMLTQLATHASKRGVTRQALIKMWLADRLETAVRLQRRRPVSPPAARGVRVRRRSAR